MTIIYWMAKNQTKLAWTFFWLLVAIFCFIYFSDHYLSADEGFVLNMAWQLWHGKTMYVDFLEYVSPGSAYIIYLTWLFFDWPSYFLAKVLTIVLILVSAGGFFLISKKILSDNYLIFIAVVTFVVSLRYYQIINHNVYSTLAAVWFLYFLIKSLDGRRSFIFAAGLLSGVVFWFLQTKGLALMGAGLLVLWFVSPLYLKERLKRGLIFLGGFGLILLPLMLLWSPQIIYHSLFVLPRELGYMNHTFISPALVTLGLAVVATMMTVAYRTSRKDLWALAVVQFAIFSSTINLVDIEHLMINAFPAIIFILFIFNKIFDILTAKISVRYFTLFVLLVLFFGLTLHLIPPSRYNIYNVDLLGGQRSLIFHLPEIQAAEYIYAGPFIPGYYFELKKPNPFYNSNMFLCDDLCLEDTLKIIKEIEPEFALINYVGVDTFNYNKDNEVDQYFLSSYFYCSEIDLGQPKLFARDACPELK